MAAHSTTVPFARRLAVAALAAVAVLAAHPAGSRAASVTLAPAAGPAGSSVELEGKGFRPAAAVVVRRRGLGVARARAGRDGTFRIRVTLPKQAAGTVALVTRSRAVKVENRFRVSARLGQGRVYERATDGGRRRRWSPTSAGAEAAAVADRQPAFPVRGAFYYPWQPETSWPAPGRRYTHYRPSLGSYDSGVPGLIRRHVRELEYAKVNVGITSWWGRGHRTDNRLPLILSETAAMGSPLRWSVYYEPEGTSDPSVEQLRADLTYLRDRYAANPAYYRVGGRFVVFVWGTRTCADADRWKRANTVGAYVVLKLFRGYTACPSQPDGWHEYAAGGQNAHAPHSFTVAPGFWHWREAAPRTPRDVNRFKQSVRNMVASNARFQLLVSFNEWGEGTAAESAAEWASPSGHGQYLDALHNDGR
jgi:hypothetical protein